MALIDRIILRPVVVQVLLAWNRLKRVLIRGDEIAPI